MRTIYGGLGHIRQDFDGKFRAGADAHQQDKQRQREDEDAVPQRETDEVVEHLKIGIDG